MAKHPNHATHEAPAEAATPAPAPLVLSFGNFSTPVSALPESTLSRLLAYGFGKMLQDAASGTVKKLTTLGESVAKGTATADEAKAWAELVGKHPDHETPEALAIAVATEQQAARFKQMQEGTLNVRSAGAPRVVGIDKLRLDAAKEILAMFAKAKGAKLPKADSPEYAAMLTKVQVAKAAEIEAKVQAQMALAESLKDSDIFG